MDSLFWDVRYAIRTLLKSPGFTIVAVLVLAIGIGATTAIFSVVDALLLRPLSFRDPDRVVVVHVSQGSAEVAPVSVPDYHSIHDRATAFENLAAQQWSSVALGRGDSVERISAFRVSAERFRVLDGPVLLGRTFAVDAQAKNGGQIVLSHALWQTQFDADPKVVGSKVSLDGEPAEVIGVMSKDYLDDDSDAEMWVLSDFDAPEKDRGVRSVAVVGRLKEGVDLRTARADIDALGVRLSREYPETNSTVSLHVVPFQELQTRESRTAVLLVLGAILLVLLIGCANVANLMLARTSGRRAEIAVRVALGATPARIVRQLVTESVVLAFIAAAFGLVLAGWGIDLLVAGFAPYVPHARRASLDARALGVSTLVSLGTAMAFGLFPALDAARADVQAGLKQAGAKASAAASSRRLRGGLVVAELALSLVLVAGAGILVKSFERLTHVERGFDAHGVAFFRASLTPARYPTEERRMAFVEALLLRLRSIPGVRAVAASAAAPIMQGGRGYFDIEGRPPFPRGHEPVSGFNAATPGYDKAMGMRVIEGRFFDAGDSATSRRVALINETLAKHFFPGESPLGKRIRTDWGTEGALEKEYSEIVGVYANARSGGLRDEPIPETLFPLAQHPDKVPHVPSPLPLFSVRVDGDAARLEPELRAALHDVDPQQPFGAILWGRDRLTSYEAVVGASLAPDRFNAALLAIVAAVALALAAIGVFGVTAYGVAQRRQELGIRMALGATPNAVVWLVLRQNAQLVGVAIAIGLGVALFASRLLTSLVFQVSPLDPVSLVAAALVLAAVALFASWLPARRATRLSPTVALRAD